MRAAVLLLSLSALLFSGVARAQCTKDVECKGDRVCTNGVCAAPDAVAPAPVVAPAPAYRRRTGLMVTGIVMASVGVGALIGALTLGVLESTCRRDLKDEYPDNVAPASAVDERERCNSYDDPLLGLTAGGLLLTGVGLPLLIVGAKKVPVTQARVSPWLTPRSGGLTLQLSL